MRAATFTVLVDAREAFTVHRRGIGRSLVDLYRAISAARPAWQIVMLHQRRGSNPFRGLPNVRATRVDLPGDRWDAWQNVLVPLAAIGVRADVIHCPANSAPARSSAPVVATIHDLIPFEITPPDPIAQRWQQRIRRAVGRADHIVTPSDYTRQQLLATFGLPTSAVTAAPWAPDRRLRRVHDDRLVARTASAFGVPEGNRYVLAFGAADPRKNSRRIAEAWAMLPADTRRRSTLLFVGFQADVLDAARDMVASVVPDKSCQVTGFIADDDLPAILTGATLVCYPSLSEGFGLPVLEAFACGTAVVTSNTTSLPEVAGEAAVLVTPTLTHEIAAGIERLLVDSQERSRLATAGCSRLKAFTWERCAELTAGALELAVRRR